MKLLKKSCITLLIVVVIATNPLTMIKTNAYNNPFRFGRGIAAEIRLNRSNSDTMKYPAVKKYVRQRVKELLEKDISEIVETIQRELHTLQRKRDKLHGRVLLKKYSPGYIRTPEWDGKHFKLRQERLEKQLKNDSKLQDDIFYTLLYYGDEAFQNQVNAITPDYPLTPTFDKSRLDQNLVFDVLNKMEIILHKNNNLDNGDQ